MRRKRLAGWTFAFLASVVALFQLALAFGAPWGSLTMGGAYPGAFPPEMRMVAFAQALIWIMFGATIVSRAGIALQRWARVSRVPAWIVVVITGISSLLNLATPSSDERLIWAPVAIMMFICSVIIARSDMSQTTS